MHLFFKLSPVFSSAAHWLLYFSIFSSSAWLTDGLQPGLWPRTASSLVHVQPAGLCYVLFPSLFSHFLSSLHVLQSTVFIKCCCDIHLPNLLCPSTEKYYIGHTLNTSSSTFSPSRTSSLLQRMSKWVMNGSVCCLSSPRISTAHH